MVSLRFFLGRGLWGMGYFSYFCWWIYKLVVTNYRIGGHKLSNRWSPIIESVVTKFKTMVKNYGTLHAERNKT